MISVFDNLDLTQMVYTRAEKTISDDIDCKHVITRVELKNLSDGDTLSLRMSLTLDEKLSIAKEMPLKISVDSVKRNIKLRNRFFRENEITKQVEKDVDMIMNLWDNSPNEIKRVY